MDKNTTVGVIVGRFQVPDLHEGHRALINHVLERHTNVLIALGSTGGELTLENFLPYQMRKEMIESHFPQKITFGEIFDHPISYRYWSQELDALVAKLFPGMTSIGYGGQNSFIKQYDGTMQTVIFDDVDKASGTEVRKSVHIPNTYEVRLGMLHAQRDRFPIQRPTSDLAILNKDKTEVILIGRHREQGLLRFPGGFFEKSDHCLEVTAAREGTEEVPGVSIQKIKHIGSRTVNDHRYRRSQDGIVTTFYSALWAGGEPKAGDDADTAGWYKVADLEKLLVPAHRELGQMLQAFIEAS